MADRYDLVIVGMGSGGMVAAEFASTLDVKVAIVERDRVGGDCLWTGCVPSKTLIASSKVAHRMRTAGAFGIEAVEPKVDSARVFERIRAVQRQIAETDDNAQRYRDMGVDVLFGPARLTSPNEVAVNGSSVEGRFILLATGSRPVVPSIEGLEQAGFLTSETVWDLQSAPTSLTLIGGGPISIEMAQAFNRLGVKVTVLQKGPGILPRDEPDLVGRLQETLRAEGVDLRLGVDTERVIVQDGMKVVHGTEAGEPRTWASEEILLGAGRRPNVEDLGLEELGVEVGRRGVVIDERSRTTVPSVYAVRDMFFPGKGKVTDFVPWCTFTDPELAHAGLTVAQAEERFGEDDVSVWRQELTHSDRARADGETAGAVVIVTAKGKVVGAHILAPHAGEMIHELALAIQQGLKLSDVASLIHVYPTYSIANGQLAAEAAFEGARKYRWLVRRGR